MTPYRKLRSTPSVVAKTLERPTTKRSSAVYVPDSATASIQVTEVIDRDDPRASCPEMNEAIMSEVRDLLKRGTFKVILKEELPD